MRQAPAASTSITSGTKNQMTGRSSTPASAVKTSSAPGLLSLKYRSSRYLSKWVDMAHSTGPQKANAIQVIVQGWGLQASMVAGQRPNVDILSPRPQDSSRVSDRARQRIGEAAIAPVIHMQAVRREECFEGHAGDVVPVPHQGEAVKQADVLLLGGGRDPIDHVFYIGLDNDPRRELRVDQHDIGPDRLHLRNAVLDQDGGQETLTSAQDGVGAQLPEHEVRMLGGNAVVEACQHVGGQVAVDPTIEHRDRLRREPPEKLGRK